jgi:polygalacturonase
MLPKNKLCSLWISYCILALLPISHAEILSIVDFGAVSDDELYNMTNRDAFNDALAAANDGDVVLIPNNTFHMVGGVVGNERNGVTVRIDGTINFLADFESWPQNRDASNPDYYQHAIVITDSSSFTITSNSHRGVINGNGKPWWNGVLLNTLPPGDSRPRLLIISHCADVLMENLTLVNSPQQTVNLNAIRAEVRYVDVLVDRRYESAYEEGGPPMPWLQPEDLNTDGIDPSGRWLTPPTHTHSQSYI